jgi:hypothetical protein
LCVKREEKERGYKMKKIFVSVLLALTLATSTMLAAINPVKAIWFIKPGYIDYAQSGMPDFDQKQDGWSAPGAGWTWCGPVSVANSLWWFDSEYESIYNPVPMPPPAISDNFPLVTAYGPWDDHDARNFGSLVRNLAFLMDTDGIRTGLSHTGTNYVDMETGISQYLQQQGINPQGDCDGDGDVDNDDVNIVAAAYGSTPGSPTWNMAADLNQDNRVNMADASIVGTNYGNVGMFYESTVEFPDFSWIEEEVERCEDVVLLITFWMENPPGSGIWVPVEMPYDLPGGAGGHYVTCAGVDSAAMQLMISDPWWDAAEAGFPGQVPVPHPPAHPASFHNDTLFVSHDAYNVLFWPPIPPPSPYFPNPVWELVGYLQQLGFPPNYHAFIRAAVAVSPLWFIKPGYPDYAQSGMPDFDQKQDGWSFPGMGWTWCGPVSVANSLWWLDSEYESLRNPVPIPPPAISDSFPLVTAYGPWDDHDVRNLLPLVNNLAFLMDTDGIRTGLAHTGTNYIDMETGISQYLQQQGINPQGDCDGDGDVDNNDINIAAAAFGSHPGQAKWNMAADLDQDNDVDAHDLLLVALNFGKVGLFYEKTVEFPDFPWIEEEIERCEDVVLLMTFWMESPPGSGIWVPVVLPYDLPGGEGGHYVTCAGVDSAAMQLMISDPWWDAAESGFPGQIPVPHVSPHSSSVHNDTLYVSHDIYGVLQWPPTPPGPPSPYPWTPVWELVGYLQHLGYPLNYHAFITAAVATSPLQIATFNLHTMKKNCNPRPTVCRTWTALHLPSTSQCMPTQQRSGSNK